MIIEGIIKIFLVVASGALSMLPQFSWSIDTGVCSVFLGIVSSVCYLLPVGTISVILGISLSLTIAKAIIALIKTLWDLLPVV